MTASRTVIQCRTASKGEQEERSDGEACRDQREAARPDTREDESTYCGSDGHAEVGA